MREFINIINESADKKDVLLEGKISLGALVRLKNGEAISIRDGIDQGLLKKEVVYHIQDNTTHGNALNYKPKWVTRPSFYTDLDKVKSRYESEGGKSSGIRVLKRTVITELGSDSDFGYIDQKVINLDDSQITEDLKPTNATQAKAAILAILNANEFDDSHKLSQIKSMLNTLNIQ